VITAALLLKEISSYVPNRADALDILSFITGVDYKDLPLIMSNKLERTTLVEDVLQKLSESCPPAYITNRRQFYGREFYVNENVLIPRYETEILVEKAIELAPCKKPRILDLCTGSGCILLSVLSEIEGATGVGVDISYDALNVANKNKQNLGLESRAEFIYGDVLGTLEGLGGFDIVLSNPPYVTHAEYETLEKSVKYEPVQALVAEDEGLAFYKKLMDIVPYLCNKNWIALAEIGAGQSKALSGFFSDFTAISKDKSSSFNDSISASKEQNMYRSSGSFEHRFYYDLSGIERVLFWKS
jgi:release factor glutamine methyltransferase